MVIRDDKDKNLLNLIEKKFLTEKEFNAIQKHSNPKSLASALYNFKNNPEIYYFLTLEDKYAILRHHNPKDVLEIFYQLKHYTNLPEGSKKIILAHSNPKKFALRLRERMGHRSIVLKEESLNIMLQHVSPVDACIALDLLQRKGLLKEENKKVIVDRSGEEFRNFVVVLGFLSGDSLLTQENFDALKEVSYLHMVNLVALLKLFGHIGFRRNNHRLTQESWNGLLRLDSETIQFVIGRMNQLPDHLFATVVFDEIIRIAQEDNANEQLQRYVHRLLNPHHGDGAGAGINHAQSTHLQSVHASISASATKLLVRYGSKLSDTALKRIINQLQRDVSKLSNSFEHEAAKRCIKRLIGTSCATFTDPTSKVTTLQLLGLSYLAIMDKENCFGELEDARKQFICGLYEIQRGYNLSEDNVDDGKEDRPICTSGTFNKLVEKLAGVHRDVEIHFVTKEIATYKLPVIVREAVKGYLKNLSSPQTIIDFRRFIKLIVRLQEGVEFIWDELKSQVVDRMFKGFGSIYKNNKDPELINLIDYGQYAELGDLNGHQPSILNSAGYSQYCKKTFQFSANFFKVTKTSRRDNLPLEYDQQVYLKSK